MSKGVTKGDAERFLNDVPEEYKFWVNNGIAIRNVEQLAEALKNMDHETFKHHSNQEKTDFSNWIRNIIGDEKLAKDLTKNKNKEAAHKKVKERVALLKKLKKK